MLFFGVALLSTSVASDESSGTTVQLLFSIDWVECETQQEAASKKVLPEKLKAVTLPGRSKWLQIRIIDSLDGFRV